MGNSYCIPDHQGNFPECYCKEGYNYNINTHKCELLGECTDDAPQSSPDNPLKITIPYSATNHLCTNKTDYYQYDIVKNTTYFITVTSENINLINVYSNSEDFNGALIKKDNKIYLQHTSDSTETLILNISPYGIANVDYTLEIKTTCDVDEQCKLKDYFSVCNQTTHQCETTECIEDTVANSPFQATEISIPFSQLNGTLCNSFGDWYKIHLNKDEIVIFELPDNIYTKTLSYTLYRLTNNEFEIVNQTGIEFKVPETGDYYLLINNDIREFPNFSLFKKTAYVLNVDYKSELCNKLNCSEAKNEICQLNFNSGKTECACNKGSIKDENGNCVNVCENIDCSDKPNTSCSVYGTASFCMCDEGYTYHIWARPYLKEEDGCVPINEVIDYVDCSDKSNSHPEGGCGVYWSGCGFQCVCDEGYILGSNGKCVTKENFCNDCNSKENTVCDDVKGKCECTEGFMENDDKNCIPLSEGCNGVVCEEENTHCEVIYNSEYDFYGPKYESQCVCNEGYANNGSSCVDIDLCSDDETGNTIQTATEITIPYSNENFFCPGKNDYFKADLTAGKGLVFYISPYENDLGYSLKIGKSSTETIDFVNPEYISDFFYFIPEETGTYYFEISSEYAHDYILIIQ